jgi:hypothetical protein
MTDPEKAYDPAEHIDYINTLEYYEDEEDENSPQHPVPELSKTMGIWFVKQMKDFEIRSMDAGNDGSLGLWTEEFVLRVYPNEPKTVSSSIGNGRRTRLRLYVNENPVREFEEFCNHVWTDITRLVKEQIRIVELCVDIDTRKYWDLDDMQHDISGQVKMMTKWFITRFDDEHKIVDIHTSEEGSLRLETNKFYLRVYPELPETISTVIKHSNPLKGEVYENKKDGVTWYQFCAEVLDDTMRLLGE